MTDRIYTGAKVLIADDNAGQRNVLDLVLSADGYHVDAVQDGREALTYLKTNTPDLIILDVLMPHFSGLEVCGRAKRVPRLKHVPVIILTSLQDEETLASAEMARADRLMIKPLSGKNLRSIVYELLEPRFAPPASFTRSKGHATQP